MRDAAELHSQVLEALTAADLPLGGQGDATRISSGANTQIWVSLDSSAGDDHGTLSEEVIAALAAADLQLSSFREPQSRNPAERLRGGELLYVALSAAVM